MKKILSMLMVISILFALGSVPASAKMGPGCVNSATLSTMADDEVIYGAVMYDYTNSLYIYEFSYWVEINYLCDTQVWDLAEDGKMFLEEYKKYIESQHEIVLSAGEDFFEKYFDSSTDELVLNSDQKPMIAVKTTAKNLKFLKNADGCSIFAIGSLEQVTQEFNANDYAQLVPSDSYVERLSPYELVYALQFFKNYEEGPRYWNEGYIGYFYSTLYHHYPEVTGDEATADEPDYLLVFAGENFASPALSADCFGDKYLVQESNCYYPYILGLHIITTTDAPMYKIYTLREAWDMGLEGIEDVFTDYGLGEIRGDSDGDEKITVKDATYVQKCLAGVTQFTDREFVRGLAENDYGEFNGRISDMNMDGELNIKDATAIQKFVAGIPYK